MKPYPHHYQVAASAGIEGEVLLASAGLEPLNTAPPIEFDGPGNRWSPETLLVGAIADCFILTFRAVARAAKLPWLTLDCEVEGVLDRDQGVSRFVAFTLRATLRVPPGGDHEAAEKALHKAETGCLISNSLSGKFELVTRVEVEAVG
jgi:peroxiredoxin-like protein